jgi:hypothetical protein
VVGLISCLLLVLVGLEVTHLKNLLDRIFSYHVGDTTEGQHSRRYQEAMKIKKSIESATKKGFFKRRETQHLEEIDAIVEQGA